MGDVVNLNKYRKEHARDAEKRAARNNRVRFGRTGAEKAAERVSKESAERILDGKKREPGNDKPDNSPEEPRPKSQ